MANQTKHFTIRSFDIEKGLKPDYAIAVVGRRGTGKTWMILNIMHAIRNFKWGIVMCGSEKTLKKYSERVPDLFCYKGLNVGVLKQVLDHQNASIAQNKPCHPVFVILDDLSYDKRSIISNPVVSEYLMNGRHANVFFIISMQDCKQVSPEYRDQFDLVFLMTAKKVPTMERLYKTFNTCFDSFNEFKTVFRACAPGKGHAMVIDVSAVDPDVADGVFRCHSKNPDSWDYIDSSGKLQQWRIGSEWWNFHDSKYNNKWFLDQLQNEKLGVSGKGSLTISFKGDVKSSDEKSRGTKRGLSKSQRKPEKRRRTNFPKKPLLIGMESGEKLAYLDSHDERSSSGHSSSDEH